MAILSANKAATAAHVLMPPLIVALTIWKSQTQLPWLQRA